MSWFDWEGNEFGMKRQFSPFCSQISWKRLMQHFQEQKKKRTLEKCLKYEAKEKASLRFESQPKWCVNPRHLRLITQCTRNAFCRLVTCMASRDSRPFQTSCVGLDLETKAQNALALLSQWQIPFCNTTKLAKSCGHVNLQSLGHPGAFAKSRTCIPMHICIWHPKGTWARKYPDTTWRMFFRLSKTHNFWFCWQVIQVAFVQQNRSTPANFRARSKNQSGLCEPPCRRRVVLSRTAPLNPCAITWCLAAPTLISALVV